VFSTPRRQSRDPLADERRYLRAFGASASQARNLRAFGASVA